MSQKISEADKARLARNLRNLLLSPSRGEDELLSNAAAARHMGNVSVKTLSRMAFPNDPDGPVPIRFSDKGNLYWSKRELEAYKIRKRIRTETILMDGVEKHSLLTDLMDF